MISAAAIQVANALDNAPRMGAEKDEPEGSRYIQISDTLAKQLSATLRADAQKQHLANMHDPDWIQREVQAGFQGVVSALSSALLRGRASAARLTTSGIAHAHSARFARTPRDCRRKSINVVRALVARPD